MLAFKQSPRLTHGKICVRWRFVEAFRDPICAVCVWLSCLGSLSFGRHLMQLTTELSGTCSRLWLAFRSDFIQGIWFLPHSLLFIQTSFFCCTALCLSLVGSCISYSDSTMILISRSPGHLSWRCFLPYIIFHGAVLIPKCVYSGGDLFPPNSTIPRPCR